MSVEEFTPGIRVAIDGFQVRMKLSHYNKHLLTWWRLLYIRLMVDWLYIGNRSIRYSLEVLAVTQVRYLKVCTKNGSRMRNLPLFLFVFCSARLCSLVENIKQLCSALLHMVSHPSAEQPRLLMAEAGAQERAKDAQAPWIGLLVTSTAFCWLSKL